MSFDPPRAPRTTLLPWEAVVVAAICFGFSTVLWPPVFAHVLWDIVPFAAA